MSTIHVDSSNKLQTPLPSTFSNYDKHLNRLGSPTSWVHKLSTYSRGFQQTRACRADA